MIQFARLGLMTFGYFMVFFISEMVQRAHKHSEVVFFEPFVSFSFLILTLSLFGWIISLHTFLKYDSAPFLKELLYVFTFVSLFSTISSFIGFC